MVTGLFFISPLSSENGLIVLLLVGKKKPTSEAEFSESFKKPKAENSAAVF